MTIVSSVSPSVDKVPALALPIITPTPRPDFSDCPDDPKIYDSADDFPVWCDEVAAGLPISPADDAWDLGFTLGLDGIPAVAPDHFSADQRVAFDSGHSIGHARYVEDCDREHLERMDQLDWAFCDPIDRLHEAEQARVLGHRVSASAER